MPTGTIDLGELFFIGPDGLKSIISSGITDFTVFDVDVEKEGMHVIRNNVTGEATLTATMKFNRKLFDKYLLGKSTNWLKMHGYPMIRKVRR